MTKYNRNFYYLKANYFDTNNTNITRKHEPFFLIQDKKYQEVFWAIPLVKVKKHNNEWIRSHRSPVAVLKNREYHFLIENMIPVNKKDIRKIVKESHSNKPARLSYTDAKRIDKMYRKARAIDTYHRFVFKNDIASLYINNIPRVHSESFVY